MPLTRPTPPTMVKTVAAVLAVRPLFSVPSTLSGQFAWL
jgi:hypothetical protein